MSFTARGGWWVVAQFVLFGLLAVALLFTEPVDEGVGLGYAQVIGWVLVAASAAVAVWSVMLHGTRLSPYPAPISDAALIDHGPYRFVRHPIYGALCFGALGLGLAFLSPLGVIVSFVFPLFFMAKSGREEEHLVEALPEYRDYRSAVPHRLIPWVL